MYAGPLRDWRAGIELAQAQLTAALRTPLGGEVLRPVQAAVLRDAWDLRGRGFAYVRAGGGKTIIAGAAPTLLAVHGFRRPLIVTSASMVKDTIAEFERCRRHWRIATFYELKSYTFFTRAENHDWLESYRPDLIILDEADACRRIGAASVPKRFDRYLAAHPECRVIAMSATFLKDRITDYAHILRWTLGEGSPLPNDPLEVEQWSMAIDDGDAAALHHLAKYGCPQSSWDAAKEWYAERLWGTPGIVLSDDEYDGSELRIQVSHVEPGHAEAFRKLRADWERPDGWALTDAADTGEAPDLSVAGSVWSVARQLSVDFFYTTDPPPPKPWLQKRKAWARFVRAAIQSGAADTELQVRIACEQSERTVVEYAEWFAIKDTFEHRRKAVWLGDQSLRYAYAWGRAAPGIIWYEHQAWGERLAAETGWRHYAGGGLDASGRHIRDANPSGGTIIASRPANYRGRNLQKWNRNFAACIVNANLLFEQHLARTHRDGQQSPSVDFEVYAACLETSNCVFNVLQSAHHQHSTTKLAQRVLSATMSQRGETPADSWAWGTAAAAEAAEIVRNGVAFSASPVYG